VEYPQDHIVHQTEPVSERIAHYGPDSDQVIEFFGESNTGKLLVLIHGGYWRPTIDRAHLRPLAKALTEKKFRVALLEYRRVQGRPDDYLSDVLTAIQSLPEEEIILVGHSAGAHLALLAGREVSSCSLILALSPVADLQQGIKENLGDGAIQLFLGEEKGALERLNPISLSAAKTRIQIMHSEHDFIPLEIAHRYFREKLDEGADIKFTLIPDADHFTLVDPRTSGLGTLLRALSEIE
jgi:acetyl esterase/lipase